MKLLTPNKKSTEINNTTNIYPLGTGMLVVIDPRVENYGILASGVLPGAKVVILESGEDGVRQVSRAIFDYPVSSLHIVGHGSPGSMQLGNTRLSLGNLAAYGGELERWGEAIGSGGILLYGCEVAAGDIGAAFVERLHELSGVGVAAAVSRVGCGELGGSWELGVKVGNVGDGLAFGEEVLVGYGGVFTENSSSIFASQINNPPTNIQLEVLDIDPASIGPVPVRNLITTDPDDNSFTYALVAGEGDEDNNLLQISGNQLLVTQLLELDSETNPFLDFRVQTTDSAGNSFVRNFSIPVGARPEFTIEEIELATVGIPYNQLITTSDADTPLNELEISSIENLPDWLNFTDNGDGTARLTGTPDENDLGNFNIQLTVTDSDGIANTQNFTLEVVDEQLFVGSITGTKFNDIDGDGFFDPDEPGIPNVTIYLDQNRNEVFDEEEEQSVLTDESGNYRFDNLTPGEYIVREVVPLNLRPTLAPQQPIIIPATGEDVTDINFGNTAANPPGISITQTGGSTEVIEGLSTDTYQIELDSNPSDPVNITINSDGQVLLSDNNNQIPSNTINLTFNPGNLGPQNITVTAVDDNIAAGDSINNIIHTATSNDQNYNGPTAPFTVDGTPSNVIAANITDDEIPNVVINPTTTDATEGGATGSYQVFLTTQPIGNVSINFNTDQQIQPIAPITFDQTNWNVPRTVTVTAVDDNIPETETQNISTIAHQVFSQSDPSYNNLNISQVTVNIDDPVIPEPTQVLINQTDGNTVFTAGGSDNYTIQLNSNPTTPIEIAIAPPPEINLGSGIGVPITLEFNESNGTTPQNVTVTGVNDGNFNISHRATLDGIDPNLQFFVDGVPTNIVNANVIALPPGSISGTVFDDFNNDNFLEFGETGLNNVTVSLLQNDIPIQQIVTDPNGNYNFSNLTPNIQYTLTAVRSPDLPFQQFPFAVTIPSGESVSNINFAYDVSDPGILQFSEPTFNVAENTPTATVTITRIGGSDGVVSANINLSSDTATQGVDFGNPFPNPIFFADGVTEQTVSIPIFDDSIIDGNKTVNLSLTNVTGDATLGQAATAILEIIDVPLAPIANPDTANITQGDPPITINVLANDQGNLPEIIAVDNLSQAGNNVTIDGINNQIIYSLAPGLTTTEPFTDTFNYTISDNNPNTPNSSATVSVEVNPQPVFPGSISGAIFNDNNRNGFREPGETGLPNVTVFIDSNENDAIDPTEPAVVTNQSGIYTFPDLLPDNYTVRTISPQPDATFTTSAEFPVSLSSSQNVNNINLGYSFPNPGTLQFSNPNFSVRENEPTATVRITRTGGSDGVVSATLNVFDGTANRGIDFGDPVPETIFFADGETQQTVSIPIVNDNSVENTETVNLSLANVNGGANIGQPATATLEIIDDDIIQPQSFTTEVLTFEEFDNFNSVGSRTVNTPQGPANLLFSGNSTALVSLNEGGQGRFSGITGSNTVLAYDIRDPRSGRDAIVINLGEIINRVGEIESGSLLFDYASPNRSHSVTFLDENNRQLGSSESLERTPGEVNDFSIFNSTNIPIPEDTQFIAIGSESTEIGIDNLQLTLQPKGEATISASSISATPVAGNIDNLELVEINQDLMFAASSFSENNLLSETAMTNSNNIFDDSFNSLFFASEII